MKISTRICCIAIALAFVIGLCLVIYKMNEYKAAIDGSVDIHGYYETSDVEERTYLSVDTQKGEYYHCTVDNEVLQQGKISKNDDQGIYELFKSDGQTVYAIIVPSYKKVYLIDSEMTTTVYIKKLDTLRSPNKEALP